MRGIARLKSIFNNTEEPAIFRAESVLYTSAELLLCKMRNSTWKVTRLRVVIYRAASVFFTLALVQKGDLNEMVARSDNGFSL